MSGTPKPGLPLGRLSFEQALDLHESGYDRSVIAARAGVGAGRVTRWRQANGLSRPVARSLPIVYGPSGYGKSTATAVLVRPNGKAT